MRFERRVRLLQDRGVSTTNRKIQNELRKRTKKGAKIISRQNYFAPKLFHAKIISRQNYFLPKLFPAKIITQNKFIVMEQHPFKKC